MAWRVARSLETLRAQLDEAHPGRSKASDGTIGDAAHQAQVSDHNPDGAGVVRALDVTHDPAHGLDIGQLSDALVASRDSRISYVIANRLITGPAYGWEWADYDGDDPHENHLHLSVVGDARADDPRLWSIGVTAGTAAAPGEEEDDVSVFMMVEGDATGTVYLTNGIHARPIASEGELADLAWLAQEGTLRINLAPGGNTVEVAGAKVRVVGRRELIGVVFTQAH